MLAAQLLAAADLWLFVTSAARYADQVPWDFLKAAVERSTAVAVVLDRTPAGGGRRGQRATSPGCSPPAGWATPRCSRSPRLRSTTPAAAGRAGAEIRLGLDSSRSTPSAGGGGAETLDRAVRSSRARTPTAPAAGGRSRGDRSARTRPGVRRGASPRSRGRVADGTLLRGEILARWQEFVGTGELSAPSRPRSAGCETSSSVWSRGKPSRPSG